MLNCVAIGPTQGLLLALQSMCAEMSDVTLLKAFEQFPASHETSRLLNVYDPEGFFLEIQTAERSIEVAREIRRHLPHAAMVGYTRQGDRALRAQATAAGVVELLVAPFTTVDLRRALIRAFEARRPEVLPNLLAFLPAKPGSGASVTAFNTAGALAANFDKKVLVIDADRHHGVLSVYANVNPPHTLDEALESSHELNDGVWAYRRVSAHGFDLLPMPRRYSTRVFPPWTYQRLIRFVCSHYDLVLADLGEADGDDAASFLRQAQTVYLVLTPEMPALTLARRRLETLHAAGLGDDRITVVLNRHPPGPALTPDVEQNLERSVAAVLPDDPAGLREATVACRPVHSDTPLGAAFHSLAGQLLGLPALEMQQPVMAAGFLSRFRRRGC